MRILDRLKKRFRDREYRRQYVDSFTDSYLATQIRVLREQRGLTQAMLADAVGMKQSQVSRLENVNNSSWQIRTLKRLADAFDLALVVRFESFGRMLPEIVDFGRASLQRPSFAEDPEFIDIAPTEQSPMVTGAGYAKLATLTATGTAATVAPRELASIHLVIRDRRADYQPQADYANVA